MTFLLRPNDSECLRDKLTQSDGTHGRSYVFDKICFLSVGQQPVVRDLYRLLHLQLCEGKPLDPALVDNEACFHALQRACLGQSILLVLDDVWDKNHVEILDCVDPASKSYVLVTSRVSGVAVGAPEVQLGRSPTLGKVRA